MAQLRLITWNLHGSAKPRIDAVVELLEAHQSDVLALHSESTPRRPVDRHVDELVLGADRVDLAAVFDELGRRGAEVVRVDSGGRLIGALLQSGLLDEVSLLIHPCFAGAVSGADRWYGPDPAPAGRFRLIASQSWDDGLVWLRYRR